MKSIVPCDDCGKPIGSSWSAVKNQCRVCFLREKAGADTKSSPLRVGALFRLNKFPVMGNPVGTLGVVYEVYDRHDAEDPVGVSIIFPNGKYDGFSLKDRQVSVEYAGFCRNLESYQFSDVRQLEQDFLSGVFREAFTMEG